MGKQAEKDNYVLDNPGISADAAKYLVEKKVNAVAIDTPSIDAGIDSDFTAHKILLSNNILIIENLCNLERINRNRFTLVAIPLKLIGPTGSPVHAIGIEECHNRRNTSNWQSTNILTIEADEIMMSIDMTSPYIHASKSFNFYTYLI